MIMAQSAPSSHLALLRQYQEQYHTALSRGDIAPFIYPRDSLAAFILILYLLVPHRKYPLVRHARFLLVAFIVYCQLAIVHRCRSRGMAAGLLLGVLAGWAVLWSATLMIFTDPQKDFKRIQRRTRQPSRENELATEKISNRSTSVHLPLLRDPARRSHGQSAESQELIEANGSADLENHNKEHSIDGGQDLSRISTPSIEYYWQTYPSENFVERLIWVLDLVTNFRGIGWNWQIPGLHGPPPHVRGQLKGGDVRWARRTSASAQETGNRTYCSRASLLRRRVPLFLLYYFLLDFCKLVLVGDRYFWGFIDSPPPTYLPSFIQHSPALVQAYRLLLAAASTNIALASIFLSGSLLFVGVLSPRLLNAQGEPWMYPDFWGSFSSVLDHGLAGWWGVRWHQAFRFVFGAPTHFLFSKMDKNDNVVVKRIAQLLTAFALSGFLHACGSYTQIPLTNPIRGPFLFFIVQGVGILVQTAATFTLTQLSVGQSVPRWVRQAANFIFTLAWLYYTGPLLVDDFARGGAWLAELIPVSPLRGLGLGLPEEGWWCLTLSPVRWHQDRHWWNSGLAF